MAQWYLLKDLSSFDVIAHEDPILTLLFLRFQEIAECAGRNLEVTMQLISKHIDLTSSFRVNKPSSIQKMTASCYYVGSQINMGPLY